MSLRKYTKAELSLFLQTLDEFTEKPFDLIVIGGAAAALAYQVGIKTGDIDTMNNTAPLAKAYDRAVKKTGLMIPFGPSGVADAPYEYEDRLQPLRQLHLKNIRLFVPEVHDFILMKCLRGYEHDLETIEEISKKIPIELETLVARFQTEMGHVIGNQNTIRLNFLATIAQVFGEKVARDVERRLKLKKI